MSIEEKRGKKRKSQVGRNDLAEGEGGDECGGPRQEITRIVERIVVIRNANKHTNLRMRQLEMKRMVIASWLG